MHSIRKITDDLIYIGASDRRISRFENLFPVPRGVSYNSYVLLDEKTVVFDTVDESVGKLFFENLEYALGGRALDYLVVHHMEPDHCALLSEVIRRHPSVKLVCTAGAVRMIGQFFSADLAANILKVSEGDKLSTGQHTLRFIMAPMVHWPEVMVTYDEFSRILFSADGFGTFGALPGNLFDDEISFDATWMNDARRYYTNIVGKYGAQVQNLLKKAASLDIAMVCPLHGPVWRENIGLMFEKYQKWSSYEPEDRTVVIAYATMYGNTENAANVLAGQLAEKGVKGIAMYDISETDVSELVAECFRCSHIVLAAPTYNGGLHPKMETLLSDLKALNLQKRTVAFIENCTWAGAAAKEMTQRLEGMKDITLIEESVSVKSALADTQIEVVDALAQKLADQLR